MKDLNIVVTVKQVPDTSEVRIDPKTNSLIREGVPSIVNPEDRNAVESALCLKEKHGGTITVLAMGPPQAEDALSEVLSMGADRGILLTDRAFAGSDTLITAFILSRAIMKLGKFDLILCGRQAIDGDTAQVGPQIAGFLDIPQITYADEINVDNNRVVARRSLEDCTELVQAALPVLITVMPEINTPRYPSLYNTEAACNGSLLTVWGARDLKIPSSMLGLNASPTAVNKIFEPESRGKGEFISGNEKEMASQLIEKLKAINVV
jgi:electron transfer flavoprotein beta subunit